MFVARNPKAKFLFFQIRRRRYSIIFSLVCVALWAVSGAAYAIENRAFPSSIVVDAKTGEVLSEDAADSPRFPASVTKVMTLYILFQELNAGNMSLSTKMSVSRHAAAAHPTKLGIPAGSTITVEDAIKSLVTISANDMARTIAEHISGTEAAFAQRMTATARALGMRHTNYANASGWPDPKNLTTVRDQAILGAAIYQHFPQYYPFFDVTSFRYGGRTYGSHNNVLGYLGAVDGLKTGWTVSSGSTILTAARKDNRHIIVAVFGYNGTRARDTKVRQLVSDYLNKGRAGDYLQAALVPMPGRPSNSHQTFAQSASPIAVTPMPLPAFRLAEIAAANAPQSFQRTTSSSALAAAAALAAPTQEPQPAYSDHDIIGAWLSQTYSLGAPPTPLGQTQPSAPLTPPVDVVETSTDPTTTGTIDPGQGGLTGKSWIVQIGATPTPDGAEGLLAEAIDTLPNLGTYRAYVEPFTKSEQGFYRARFTGFGSRDAANAMCGELQRRKFDCLAIGG